MTYYNNLSKKYNQFKIKALTIDKALDSIEYHKSETTRAILNTLKKVNLKDIVPMDIALYYVSCETLSQTLLEFFEQVIRINRNFSKNFTDKYFETTLLLLKVFKESKHVYESVFKVMSAIDYSYE